LNPSEHSPKRIAGYSLAFAALCVFLSYLATEVVRSALLHLEAFSAGWNILFTAVILATATLFWPAIKSWRQASASLAAKAAGNLPDMRIASAASKDHAYLTFGWGAFALVVLGFISFILLPLIQEKWWLVTRQFLLNNIFIFVIAEILVLVWGLAVALARMLPGPAGKPIRALAIAYCDVFRGLPAVVTLYLIGFGLPISGLPELIVPHIVGLWTDLSGMTPAEYKTATRVPVVWWCILALTLTYGAYVAEVYRAGIESIHWSQVSAARSLGLSYMQTMRHVIIPQAVRRILAPLLNDFIGLQKDTALVQVVGVIDAFNQSRIIASAAFNLSAVTIVAILFVLVTIPQARFVDRLIERDNARMRAGG
jgi:polar amino acid transport system permease protein